MVILTAIKSVIIWKHKNWKFADVKWWSKAEHQCRRKPVLISFRIKIGFQDRWPIYCFVSDNLASWKGKTSNRPEKPVIIFSLAYLIIHVTPPPYSLFSPSLSPLHLAFVKHLFPLLVITHKWMNDFHWHNIFP